MREVSDFDWLSASLISLTPPPLSLSLAPPCIRRDTDKPANTLNGTKYEEAIFRDRMLSILHEHDQTTPLFLTYTSKLCHYPMMAPEEYQELPRIKAITQDNRRVYHAMVAYLDDQLANITNTMKALGMWENTLMVLTSDNGGYVKAESGPCNSSGYGGLASSDVGHGTSCFNGEAGANNWPLRGGKYSNYEGGLRVNAFVSGGFVPLARRGVKLEGTIHIADWCVLVFCVCSTLSTSSSPTSALPPLAGMPRLQVLQRLTQRTSLRLPLVFRRLIPWTCGPS